MPPSPIEQHVKKVAFRDDVELVAKSDPPATSATKYYSQPMPTGVGLQEGVAIGKSPNRPPRNPRVDKLKDDERYNSFKTFSGRLERQISNLRGKPTNEPQVSTPRSEINVPVDRSFDALTGPELDTLRVSL